MIDLYQNGSGDGAPPWRGQGVGSAFAETAAPVWQAIPSSRDAFPDMIREPHHRAPEIEIFSPVQRLPIWTPDRRRIWVRRGISGIGMARIG